MFLFRISRDYDDTLENICSLSKKKNFQSVWQYEFKKKK